MNDRDVALLMKAIAPVVADIVQRATGPLVERIAALEARKHEKGEKGDPGQPGDKGEKGEAGPVGPAGEDGKDANEEEIAQRVFNRVELLFAERFQKMAAEVPVPVDGRDGRDGVDGKDGAAGKSVTVEEVAPLIRDEVAKAVAQVPVIKGEPGQDGPPGIAGPPGRDGRDGSPGVPGPAGRDGINGKDGLDGLSPSDFFVELKPDKRTFVFGLKQAEDVVYIHEITVPIPLYQGVFKHGETYSEGDTVTWGGSTWIALKNEPHGKPDGGTGDWRLCVKHGRDGKDAPKDK